MLSMLFGSKVKSVDVNSIETDKVKLIDIRETYETRMGSIKGSKKIPMNELLDNPEKYLNKEDEFYIMCQSGMRSSKATKELNKLGYKVVNVSGGFGSYRGKNIK